MLWQLSLPCCHGTEHDAVWQVDLVEHDQVGFLHVYTWQVCQVWDPFRSASGFHILTVTHAHVPVSLSPYWLRMQGIKFWIFLFYSHLEFCEHVMTYKSRVKMWHVSDGHWLKTCLLKCRPQHAYFSWNNTIVYQSCIE